ncbi:MAG: DUF3991 and TOPRIM domain-containing protein [Clostridia bacterium]|nr:DUF3991 and TOPRIM domain-containing protein [Clostridia bacterium]
MLEYQERARLARVADLYTFLVDHHSSDVEKEGRFLRLKSDRSIVIKQGHSGYTNYTESPETGHGNGIDLLTRYLSYTPADAINALTEGISVHPVIPIRPAKPVSSMIFEMPMRDDKTNRVYAYLTKTRGLSVKTVSALTKAGLLYQDQPYGNAVFVNHDQDYCEIRGTCSYCKPFHGVRKKDSSGYWSFRVGRGDIQIAYICEAAIDALSLYELHKASGLCKQPTLYCSIGGVSNQGSIDRVSSDHSYSTILAVDNDEAGLKCVARNPHLDHITPIHKDWNEDLKYMLLKACQA